MVWRIYVEGGVVGSVMLVVLKLVVLGLLSWLSWLSWCERRWEIRIEVVSFGGY